MVDIFGIKKEAEPVTLSGSGALPAADAAPGSRTRPTLWGALLVVDSVLVIVFGGAMAAKLYQHLTSPVSVAPAARRKPGRPAAPPTEAPKPVEVSAAPLTAGALPSAPGRQDGGTGAPPPASTAGPKAAKPSLLAEPIRSREAPRPHQAAGRTAETQPPVTPATSMPVEKRHSIPVEFKLKAPHARSVQLIGAFIVRGGGRREMVRQDEGIWTLTLYLLPGDGYRYWFLVNGKKTLDPENRQMQRGASVLVLP